MCGPRLQPSVQATQLQPCNSREWYDDEERPIVALPLHQVRDEGNRLDGLAWGEETEQLVEREVKGHFKGKAKQTERGEFEEERNWERMTGG